jgi:hypothetical protein
MTIDDMLKIARDPSMGHAEISLACFLFSEQKDITLQHLGISPARLQGAASNLLAAGYFDAGDAHAATAYLAATQKVGGDPFEGIIAKRINEPDTSWWRRVWNGLFGRHIAFFGKTS